MKTTTKLSFMMFVEWFYLGRVVCAIVVVVK